MRSAPSHALTFALVVVGTSAHAAKSVDKESFKGSQASTSFSSTTSTTCADHSKGTVTANGFITGSDSISKETGSPKTVTNGVSVELDNYSNSCTGASVGFGDGTAANGYTPPNKKLNSAGLEGTVPVQDIDSGYTATVVLDLVIEGTGPISAEKSHSRTRTVQGKKGPVTIEIDTSADSNRSGVVSGTISIDGVELDATFDGPTTLSSNASKEITITKN
jgi:hypothetical protein